MKIFGLIEKINARDDGTIEIEGIASTEDRDDQNEIVSSSAIRAAIPDFMKWGAIREMHGLQAAGTALQLTVDDDKITRISAHIVDPIAILKVKNRVYKGFSIGGQVTSRNPTDSKIITGIKLNEVSLVDRPANPSAVLEMWKAGVSEGEHSMSNGLGTLADTDAGKKLAALQSVQVWTCGEPEHQHVAKAEAEKCMAARFSANEHELEKARLVPVDKEAEPSLTSEEIVKRAEEGANAAQDALLEAQRAIERGEVTLVDEPPVDEPTKKSGSVDNTPAQPNPNSAAVLSTAVVAKDGDAPGDGSKPVVRFRRAATVDLAKSLFDVGRVASLIMELDWIYDDLTFEATIEGDNSPQPARMNTIIAELCGFLNALVAEETAEILDNTEIDEPLGMDMGPVALSAIAGSLRKSIVDKDKVERLVSKLQKAGAQHNAMDQMHLDRAANNTATAMNMDGCTKADMVHLSDSHKALIDAGAIGGGGSLPSGGATENATVDTGHNAEHSAPTSGTMVPKASDMSLMFDALSKAGAIPGSEEIVAEADAFYKAGAKPHQVLANLAHGHIAAACDGATCKQDAAKPARHSGVTMAHLHKAHFGLTKCSGAMKCDAAAAMIPGGAPNAAGESEGQGGTGDSSKAATVTNEGGGDLVKVMTALTQMVTKLADQLEVKTSEVADLKQAAAAHEKRLDVVENQPVPPKTAASGTVAISKQQDGGGSGSNASEISDEDVAKRWQAMTPKEQTLALIKGAHVTSPIALRGFTDGPVPQNPRAPEGAPQP